LLQIIQALKRRQAKLGAPHIDALESKRPALLAAGCLLTKPSGAKQELHLLLLHAQLSLHLPPLHLRLRVHERDRAVDRPRNHAWRSAGIVPGHRLDDGLQI
jgi:hypothetical protein